MTFNRHVVELGALPIDQGGAILLRRAAAAAQPGEQIEVRGSDPSLAVHLRAWARREGHRWEEPTVAAPAALALVRGDAADARRAGALLAGHPNPRDPDAVAERAAAAWGIAPRGAEVEAGAPPHTVALMEKCECWADEIPALLQHALAAQWNPQESIPWDQSQVGSEEVESALVQVLTYLIENETAALLISAHFAGQVHPHFREVMQLLALQSAEEARHIEVFTRRATMRRSRLGSSTAGGQASLRTLLEEPRFPESSLLLSVLGEGTFVDLLRFLQENAPDPCTAAIMRLAAQDESRHVAFGMAHLSRMLALDPGRLPLLELAMERRHAALRETTGLNEAVFESLVVLAGGGIAPAEIARGFDAVARLTQQMHAGRRRRLETLGFEPARADALAGLHTRNFM